MAVQQTEKIYLQGTIQIGILKSNYWQLAGMNFCGFSLTFLIGIVHTNTILEYLRFFCLGAGPNFGGLLDFTIF